MRTPWGLRAPEPNEAGNETYANATQPLETPEKVHGFCYLANQAYLIFGHNRAVPISWRPVVSLRRTNLGLYVLPSTTKYKQKFFHLSPKDCFEKRKQPEDPKDSYLCPRYELLLLNATIEIGIVPQPVRLAIAAWLVKSWTHGT